eukprot:TRINITY_DN24384_c0_g1_i1.p1 TRINITY_DN24384_c0_g1~~TRINITY_DN24384_c0_g1_i1.p1  ORF type:complete len:120 (+),score=11.98 TRINITY_DN24384_c0_g1_i1:32-361(+)
MEAISLFKEFQRGYSDRTPRLTKIIDVFLLYVLLTGVLEFVYCAIVGTFPFNSFLAGFISTVGTFVLGVCLRLQVSPANHFKNISKERAFFDFIFANVVLHLTVFNFLG